MKGKVSFRAWQALVGLTAAAVLGLGCGGTGGGGSPGSGNPFLFTPRGQISLQVILDPDNPAVLTIIATLRDPRGNFFPNQTITFTADFADVTFIPGTDNRSSRVTDESGSAEVKLIAGLTTGRVRIMTEAFGPNNASLNLAAGVSVLLGAQGFITLGPLGVIPVEVTFVNPVVLPDAPPKATFRAVGGTPP